MRSPREILFRLRQEFANAWLYLRPPSWSEALTGPLPGLPDPAAVAERLRPTAFRTRVESLAEELLAHRFRLLGLEPVDLGNPIRWRRDFVHGQETGTAYFRRIPYLDFDRVGDHKVIWELNRHQHSVVLAQAFVLTGRREFLEEIPRQIDEWMEQNPVQRGINWASALEVAFRALSWLWVLHLVGQHFDAGFRRRWMRSLYHHGLHLEHNLSAYFSPNTHLLGEAVALNALGRLLPEMPRAEQWRQIGGRHVIEQMDRQVRPDGSHFEQSAYYHVYALDMFLLHSVLNPEVPPPYRAKLIGMAGFLDALVSSQGLLPLIGDDDGGRLFHPYGERQRFAEATLATCACLFGRKEWVRNPEALDEQGVWWLGAEVAASPQPVEARSRLFADAGVAVLRSGPVHAIVDAGEFGPGSAGHSHADTLSLVVFRDGEEFLIDPGTFTYVADPVERQRYRGTAAHNTVCIDGMEQAEPEGSFRWTNPPQVEVLRWEPGEARDILEARCQYRGFTHRRSVIFEKPNRIVVTDQVDGPAGHHQVEQRWLFARERDRERIQLSHAGRDETASRSRAFGASEVAWARVAHYEGNLPVTMEAVLDLGGSHESP